MTMGISHREHRQIRRERRRSHRYAADYNAGWFNPPLSWRNWRRWLRHPITQAKWASMTDEPPVTLRLPLMQFVAYRVLRRGIQKRTGSHYIMCGALDAAMFDSVAGTPWPSHDYDAPPASLEEAKARVREQLAKS